MNKGKGVGRMTIEEANRIVVNELIKKEDEKIMDWLNQQPCNDALEKTSAAGMTKEEALTLWLPVIKMGVKDMPECNEALDMATKALEQKQDPNTGHWVRKTKVDRVYDIAGVETWGVECQCDKCGFIITVIDDSGYYKYCPKCGDRKY